MIRAAKAGGASPEIYIPWTVPIISIFPPFVNRKSAPQTAQRWLLFGGIALLVLGFLVSVTFYRCPHCHRVLPANRGKMDDCPYCKLPLRDTK